MVIFTLGKQKSHKNGWDIRERTDPESGLVRPMKILFRNGIEIEHHWLDINSTGQTEWGEIVDANSENKITLRKDELNEKYWKRYRSQVDYPGEDTKLEKSSKSYKEKLDAYRSSNSYKTRYSTVKNKSVQCRSVTQDGIRCQNQTTDTSGLCYVHLDQNVEFSARCSGINRDGSRCLNATTNQNGFCSIHQTQNTKLSREEQIVTLLHAYSRNMQEIEVDDKLIKEGNSFNEDFAKEYSERKRVAKLQQNLLKSMLPENQYSEMLREGSNLQSFYGRYYFGVTPPHRTIVDKKVTPSDLKIGDLILDDAHQNVYVVEQKTEKGGSVEAKRIYSMTDSKDFEKIVFKRKSNYEIVNRDAIEPISLAAKGKYLDPQVREIINATGD